MTSSRRKAAPSSERELARKLLRFAIQRIAQDTKALHDCHVLPSTGEVRPESVAAEIRENRDWLAEARKAIR